MMAAEGISKINGSPEPALTVATELLGDPEWWLVGHAADLRWAWHSIRRLGTAQRKNNGLE